MTFLEYTPELNKTLVTEDQLRPSDWLKFQEHLKNLCSTETQPLA